MLIVQWLASKLIQPRQCHPGVASNVFRIIKPTYKYKKHNGASVVPDFHRCCFVAAVVDSLFDDGAFQAILPKARSCKLRILRIRFYLKPAQLLGCSNLDTHTGRASRFVVSGAPKKAILGPNQQSSCLTRLVDQPDCCCVIGCLTI